MSVGPGRAVIHERLHLPLMLALTFGTGIVDAIGFLGYDRVFTANMTGNVVILGMAVTGADGLPVLGPLLALGGFLVGAACGGRALRGAPAGWSPAFSRLLTGVGVALLVTAVLAVCLDRDHPGTPVAITTLTAAAMGSQAAAARFLAVKDVTSVVVTSTLTSLAADSVLGAGKPGLTGRRVLAVLCIGAGATVGAMFTAWHVGGGLLLAAAVVLSVALVGSRAGRSSADARADAASTGESGVLTEV